MVKNIPVVIKRVGYSIKWDSRTEGGIRDWTKGGLLYGYADSFEIAEDSTSIPKLKITVPANRIKEVGFIPEIDSYILIETGMSIQLGGTKHKKNYAFVLKKVEYSSKTGLLVEGYSIEYLLSIDMCLKKSYVSTEQVLNDDGTVAVEPVTVLYLNVINDIKQRIAEYTDLQIEYADNEAKTLVETKITEVYSTTYDSTYVNLMNLIKFLGLKHTVLFDLEGGSSGTRITIVLYKSIQKERKMKFNVNRFIDSMSVSIDTTNRCTKVLPIGRDGLTLADDMENSFVTHGDSVVDYGVTKVIEFNECRTKESLRNKAYQYIEEHEDPEITIEMSMKYNNAASLFTFNLHDNIQVYLDSDKFPYLSSRINRDCTLMVQAFTRDFKKNTVSGIKLSNRDEISAFQSMMLGGKSVIQNPSSTINRLGYLQEVANNNVTGIQEVVNADGTRTYTLTYANKEKQVITLSNDSVTGLLNSLNIGGTSINFTTINNSQTTP